MSLLLLEHKNNLYEIIQNSGINPSIFRVVENKNIFLIAHDKSGYYYRISENKPYIYLTYSPSEYAISDELEIRQFDFAFVESTFKEWIICFKKEISLPDYWKILTQQMNDLGTYEFINDDFFTDEESIQITEKLKLISAAISDLPMLTDQIQAINNKLDNIAGNVKKLDKISWRDHLIGGIIGIVSQYAITPSNATLIWGILKSYLNPFRLLPI